MYVMVERLRRQGDRVYSESVEHVQYFIAIEDKDRDDLTIIRSRKELREPVCDPYERSSVYKSRSGRRYKRDRKGNKEKDRQKNTIWTKTRMIPYLNSGTALRRNQTTGAPRMVAIGRRNP